MKKVTVTLPKGFKKATEGAVARTMHALNMVARDRITQLAQDRLKSTAQTYINAVSTPVVSDRSSVITLNGRLPNMLEKGTNSFDLKKMLKGRPYVDIPFRHIGVPKADMNVMKASVRAAKAVGGSPRSPNVMPSKPKTKISRFGMYSHALSRFASMIRISHTYKGATGAHYMTFRRMSQKSDPASWIHPGFRALGIFPLVANEIRKLAPKVFADYLKGSL